MQGLIHGNGYSSKADALCAEHEGVGEVIDAVEWELVRAEDFSRYPLVANTSKGPVHHYLVPSTPVRPGVVVLFGFETFGGETKVLLIDLKLHEPDEEENGEEDEDE
jgi:hypothetical protein